MTRPLFYLDSTAGIHAALIRKYPALGALRKHWSIGTFWPAPGELRRSFYFVGDEVPFATMESHESPCIFDDEVISEKLRKLSGGEFQ